METYDKSANGYDRLRFGTDGGKYFDLVEKTYASRFLTGKSVLHIGTATGRFTKLLPKLGYDYVGIEVSKSMATMSHTTSRNLARDVVSGDAEILPFRKSTFDNVLCVRSFHFLPAPETFLREGKRVLRAEGRIIVSFELFVPPRSIVESLGIFPKPLPPRSTYRVKDVVAMFHREGLRVLWEGKVTKLPLMAYFRSSGASASIIRRIHNQLPTWFGTVGMVVGEAGP